MGLTTDGSRWINFVILDTKKGYFLRATVLTIVLILINVYFIWLRSCTTSIWWKPYYDETDNCLVFENNPQQTWNRRLSLLFPQSLRLLLPWQRRSSLVRETNWSSNAKEMAYHHQRYFGRERMAEESNPSNKFCYLNFINNIWKPV